MKQTITLSIILTLSTACQEPSSDEVDQASQALTAPVAGAVAKPSAFVIVPPWASGVSHSITRSYDAPPDHAGVNSIGGSNDYYALDFNLSLNEAIYPIAGGTVTFAGTATSTPDGKGFAGYGNIVFINHVIAGVNYQSLYTHLNSLSVTTGATVSTGTILGLAGNTGTQDVHLHFAIYRGASFQHAPAAVGPFGGNAVVPEAFSSCTKNGGSCENLVAGNVLVKPAAAPPSCGAACTQCVLTLRTDILPFYQQNGWDTSCGNRDAILANWCTIDPAGCAAARSSPTCQTSCIAQGSCGNACTACVLQQRGDILPFYRQNGWDTSCGNRNAIVTNWCTIDPNGCAAVKTGSACRSSCV